MFTVHINGRLMSSHQTPEAANGELFQLVYSGMFEGDIVSIKLGGQTIQQMRGEGN